MSIKEQISELISKYEALDARRLKQFNEVVISQSSSGRLTYGNERITLTGFSMASPWR